MSLIRTSACDALCFGLPCIARSLVCSAPNASFRVLNLAAGEYTTFGPQDRAALLDAIGKQLGALTDVQSLWPGGGLLPPLQEQV